MNRGWFSNCLLRFVPVIGAVGSMVMVTSARAQPAAMTECATTSEEEQLWILESRAAESFLAAVAVLRPSAPQVESHRQATIDADASVLEREAGDRAVAALTTTLDERSATQSSRSFVQAASRAVDAHRAALEERNRVEREYRTAERAAENATDPGARTEIMRRADAARLRAEEAVARTDLESVRARVALVEHVDPQRARSTRASAIAEWQHIRESEARREEEQRRRSGVAAESARANIASSEELLGLAQAVPQTDVRARTNAALRAVVAVRVASRACDAWANSVSNADLEAHPTCELTYARFHTAIETRAATTSIAASDLEVAERIAREADSSWNAATRVLRDATDAELAAVRRSQTPTATDVDRAAAERARAATVAARASVDSLGVRRAACGDWSNEVNNGLVAFSERTLAIRDGGR